MAGRLLLDTNRSAGSFTWPRSRRVMNPPLAVNEQRNETWAGCTLQTTFPSPSSVLKTQGVIAMSHRGFSHIGLSTLDLDKTREFYEGVLGFTPSRLRHN